MNRRSLSRILFTPSFLGGMSIFFLVSAVIGYCSWAYVTSNRLLDAYLSGPYGLKTFVDHQLLFNDWNEVIFSNPIAYYILLVGAAALVGMAVYALLQLLESVVRQSSEIVASLGGSVSGRRRIELFQRLILRCVSLAGWAVYLTLFVGWLLPTTVLAIQSAADLIRHGNNLGWAVGLATGLFLFIALHLHIVFLRLVLLRARIFGGENDIIEVQSRPGHVA